MTRVAVYARYSSELQHFDLVLAEDIDRLARNQADGARLFERLAFLGIPIWTVADGETNEMHWGLKGTMSALFLKTHALKVRRGQAGRVRAGRFRAGCATATASCARPTRRAISFAANARSSRSRPRSCAGFSTTQLAG